MLTKILPNNEHVIERALRVVVGLGALSLVADVPGPELDKKPKEDDAPRKKGPREYTLADLPKQCKDVLASD